MDARDLDLLRDVATDAIRFEYLGYTAITNGLLTDPEARCTFIVKAPCSESLVVDAETRCTLELDMYVEELAALELRFDRLDRAPDELAAFWIDDAIRDHWATVCESYDAFGDERGELEIRAGNCVYIGQLAAGDRERMRAIAELVSAISTAPGRRRTELAAALDPRHPRGPSRVRPDGPGLVIAERGLEIEIAFADAAAGDCGDRHLRTVLRAATGETSPLVVVDRALARKRRPAKHGKLVDVPGTASWLADNVVPEPLLRALSAAHPAAVLISAEAVVVTIAGIVTDPARLANAVALIAAGAGAATAQPYR